MPELTAPDGGSGIGKNGGARGGRHGPARKQSDRGDTCRLRWNPGWAAATDWEELANNLARMVEQGGKALAAYLKPREEGRKESDQAEFIDMVRTLGKVAEYWLTDPQRAFELQSTLGKGYLDLWAHAARRMAGEEADPVAKPDPRDKRFTDPEWSSNQFFDFLKQAYLLTVQFSDRLVKDAEGLDPMTRQKAEFYLRQIVNAIAPSNFVLTNPELLRDTLASKGENLARGMHMLAEDIQAGGGDLRIRQTDTSHFEVGRNLASTPGKVIFENELMQLHPVCAGDRDRAQGADADRAALDQQVLRARPHAGKILHQMVRRSGADGVRDLLGQSRTAICRKRASKTTCAKAPSPRSKPSSRRPARARCMRSGYCVGGTLLAVTLAHMAATKDQRIVSSTFFASQVDFTYSGDLKIFADEDQITALEKQMAERGYLDSRKMANTFNLMRSNDLIWPYIINNYFKGKTPPPFDLLYWNADATRMPPANHSFYLRNCYLKNKLARGEMVIAGKTLDLKKVKVPIYNLGTREDHIAPAKSVFYGSKYFGGAGAVRALRLRPHRGRGQSARQAEVSVLDRAQAFRRRRRQVARQGDRACGLLVAGLVRLAQGP